MAELLSAAGRDLGTSRWHAIGQADVDAFAAATGDDQWIHVDPVRASQGPFGRPVAHGYLLLSILPLLMRDVLEVVNRRLTINYGIDRIRFTAPVPVGSNVRLRAKIANVEPRGEGALVHVAVELEIENAEKPALVGEILSLVFGKA